MSVGSGIAVVGIWGGAVGVSFAEPIASVIAVIFAAIATACIAGFDARRE